MHAGAAGAPRASAHAAGVAASARAAASAAKLAAPAAPVRRRARGCVLREQTRGWRVRDAAGHPFEALPCDVRLRAVVRATSAADGAASAADGAAAGAADGAAAVRKHKERLVVRRERLHEGQNRKREVPRALRHLHEIGALKFVSYRVSAARTIRAATSCSAVSATGATLRAATSRSIASYLLSS